MIFSIDARTYIISGTRGDSGTITFQFNRDMDGATIIFVVKKNIETDDANAYITKTATFPTTDEIVAAGGGNPNNTISVVLMPEDTISLPLHTCDDDDDDKPPAYNDFIWGLKVMKDTTYIETVVPNTGACYPKFRLYRNINSAISIAPPPVKVTFYATTINVDILTLQLAQPPGSMIVITMASENGGAGKQTLAVPLLWGAATAVYQYDNITSTWIQIDLATFTLTQVVINSITYRNYANNLATIGSRPLKFIF